MAKVCQKSDAQKPEDLYRRRRSRIRGSARDLPVNGLVENIDSFRRSIDPPVEVTQENIRPILESILAEMKANLPLRRKNEDFYRCFITLHYKEFSDTLKEKEVKERDRLTGEIIPLQVAVIAINATADDFVELWLEENFEKIKEYKRRAWITNVGAYRIAHRKIATKGHKRKVVKTRKRKAKKR